MVDLWVATAPLDVAPCLSSADVQRAIAFVYDVDRERWTRSRSIVRRILAARYVSTCPEQIGFAAHPGGKPYVEGSTLEFNLSHSRDAVALAVSDSGPVGVDIEWSNPETDVTELTDTVFHPDEMRFWRRSGASHAIFYRLWCAKEAAAKAEGTGFVVDPKLFVTSRWDHDHCFVRGTRQLWRATIAVENEYTLCVATPACADAAIRRFSIAEQLGCVREFREVAS